MPYIYCITNQTNQKKYVGKSTTSIEQRWKEHCADALKERCEKRPLYDAINKYGIELFSIELLEECGIEELADKEIKWINELNTYKVGYNATLGGDGSISYNYQEIVDYYNKGFTIKETANNFQCDPGTVSKILNLFDIDTFKNHMLNKSKRVKQYNKMDEYIQTFSSTSEAAKWLHENNYVKNLSSGVRGKISNVANGTAKTAYKFKWVWDN